MDVTVKRLPDDLDQLAHVDVVGNQKLRLVQNRKLLLALVPLNDDLDEEHQEQRTRKIKTAKF